MWWSDTDAETGRTRERAQDREHSQQNQRVTQGTIGYRWSVPAATGPPPD